MLETLRSLLVEISARYTDQRVQVFEVQAESGEGEWVALNGKVLDEDTLSDLRTCLETQLPGLQVDYGGIRVLRSTPPRLKSVATNLTGLYASPSWQAEMLTQLFYGWELEVLDECVPWVFVRLADGYLGWTYLPYLTDSPSPAPTHLVIAPASYVRSEITSGSQVVGRLLCGTAAQVVRWANHSAEIDAQVWGWVNASDLRALEDLPRLSNAERRAMMVADATRLTGVPYLAGGCSAMGVDSAGLIQLIHRLVGIEIPRDADMQFEEGRKVEPPFQPGDLLFFKEKGRNQIINHVGVSLGGWRIIHSSRQRNGVYFDDVMDEPQLKESFIGACSYLF
jgi:cell wall-associated NlpC family hydrolase